MKNPQRLFITIALLASLLTTTTSILGASITWTGAAADTLWSSGGNWSPTGSPGAADNVLFTNTAAALSPGIGSVNNVVDAGFANSINSLAFMNTNGYHNTSLVNPLTVVSSSASDVAFIADDGSPSILFVGSGQADGTAASVYATIAGSSLVVSNGNANLSVMQINGSDSAGYRATLDLTGLNSFVCTVSNVQVGVDAGTVNSTRPHGTLLLAKTNVLTAAQILVADVYNNGSGQTCFLRLGQSSLLHVDKVRVGLRKMRGTMNFNAGLTTPSVTFRNAAGTGRANALEVGDCTGAGGSSSQTIGILDLSGGTVDALVDRLTVGRGQDADGQGDGTGTLTFGGGTIDANTLELGIQQFAGRSVGHGTLNVNNDAGVGPALLTVHNDVTLATQINASTDTSGGTTAIINLNGGTMTVAGNINDGAGLSTINLSQGGTLNVSGNVSVDVLNLSYGSLASYNTLSVSNINLLGPVTQFTVSPGQTLTPRAVGTNDTLTVSGDIALRGNLSMDISKFGGVPAADLLTASGTIDMGGTLSVTFSGDTALASGDKFTLLSATSLGHAFTTLNLPALDSGLAWLDNIYVDGSIQVVTNGGAGPTFTKQPGPAAFTCYPDASMTLRPAVTGQSPIFYRWKVGSSYVPGATNLTVQIAALGLSPGTYSVTLEASNAVSVAASTPVSITVITNPPAVQTVYADTFSDPGTVALNGRQPEASPGCTTWQAGSGMSVTGGELPYPGHWENYLPFTPQWGHVYTFSVDINVLSGGGNWLAMGFVNSPNVSSGGFYVGATSWLLEQGNRQGVGTFDNNFAGSQSLGAEWCFDPSGFSTFTIVLDTTTGDTNANTGWTVSFVENGVLLGTSPHVLGANPANLFIGIGGSDGVTGAFDNLRLTDSAPGSSAPTPPVIQPASVEVYSNTPVTFTATTAGACPITYQWKLGTTSIPGATNATLVLSNVLASQAGSYYVVASNFFGGATSASPAVLTVLPDPVQAYVLYQESFTGTGGSGLDGRTPEISFQGQAWAANPVLIVDTNQLYAPPGGDNQAAYLPFEPAWGHVYVLSVAMDPLTGGANWFDFGFTPDVDTTKVAPDIGGGPWMLQRADRSGSQMFALGYGSVGSGDGGNATGYTSWKIVLDTTTGDPNANTGWTVTFVEGQPGSFGRILVKYVYGLNPTIYFASLGNTGSVGTSGNYDNFLLTDSLSPLSIAKVGGNLVVSWPSGTLLEAPSVTGPWTTNNATSPYTFAPAGQQKFFRVRLQ